jgi:hypothetical protein
MVMGLWCWSMALRLRVMLNFHLSLGTVDKAARWKTSRWGGWFFNISGRYRSNGPPARVLYA